MTPEDRGNRDVGTDPDRAPTRGPDPDRRATIVDVAAAAGVSRQTVTRAMNDMPGISVATKRRVFDAAKELRYRPSRFGRGLVNPRQHTLGLLVTDLSNPYYPELASAVIGEATGLGWSVLVMEERHAVDHPRQVAELAGQVDALVADVGTDQWLETVTGEKAEGRLAPLPTVRVGIRAEHPDDSAVGLELAPAIDEAVGLLAASGARRPVVLDAPTYGSDSRRSALFIAAWQQRGIRAEIVRMAKDTSRDGVEGVGAALAQYPDLDALFTFNDIVALGALDELHRRDVAVPEQVRLVGVDGLQIGALVSPPLTTLAIDFAAVARSALELAVGMDDGTIPRTGPRSRRVVNFCLLVRRSA